MASRKFCCCLPVRLGVFCLSALTGLFSLVWAGSIWYTVVHASQSGLVAVGTNLTDTNITNTNFNTTKQFEDALNTIRLDKTQLISFIIAGILMTILAISSILGFFGAVVRKLSFVVIYSKVMAFILGLELGSGIIMILSVIRQRNDLINTCLAQVNNESNSHPDINKDVCNTASKFLIIWYIVVFVIHWCILLYCVIVVRHYAEQLQNEQGFSHVAGGNKINLLGGGPSSFYPHQPLGKNDHEMEYPYSQSQNAFGSTV